VRLTEFWDGAEELSWGRTVTINVLKYSEAATVRSMSNESSSAIKNEWTPQLDSEYRTIDLRDFVLLLWQKKNIVFGFCLGGALVGAAAALIIHPGYDAYVRLMPPSSKEPSLSLLLPTKNTGDLSRGLISSRTVADDVIEHQHLAEYFHTTRPSALRRALDGMVTISVDKDQFVTVKVRAKEPDTAVRIANEYPEALYRLNHSVALSEAGHRWEFFEGPLEQEKNNLAKADEELKRAQQRTGMVMPSAQIQLGVSAIAELKQQVTQREEQLAVLRIGTTDENPDVVRLKSQIASLNGQIHRLEEQTGGKGGDTSPANLPELTLEVERKTREVKFHETLFQILSRQYENARVDQTYAPPIELVDRAVLPDEKSWPPRKLFFLAGFVLGGLLGVSYIGLLSADILGRMKQAMQKDQASLGASGSGL
jgi:tyrosine-protein kinase Etk/Wzc